MLFKLLWDILKRAYILIPVLLLAVAAFSISQSQLGKTLFTLFSSRDQDTAAWNVLQAVWQWQESTPAPAASVSPTPTPWPKSVKTHVLTEATEVVFSTEVAQTSEERQIGYMYRQTIGDYSAMLFVFSSDSSYPFWMKNVQFSLDMIFLDSNFKIVDIIDSVPPCAKLNPQQDNCPYYTPKAPYRYVLEVKGNTVKQLGITETARIRID